MAATAAKKDTQSPHAHYGERFGEAEFSLARFHHKTEMGITKAQLLNPEYWSFVGERMSPYSEIIVRSDDGTYYARFLVLDCGRNFAKVQCLDWYNLTTKDVAESQSNVGTAQDYDIVWKGPRLKHIILRKSDGVVIHEGDQLKVAAQMWLDDFLQTKAPKNVPAEEPSPAG